MKKVLKIIMIVLIIGVVGFGGYTVYKMNQERTLAEKKVEELEKELAEKRAMEAMVPVYRLNKDVPSGKEILEEDLEVVSVNEGVAEGFLSSSNMEEFKKYRYKISYKKGMLVSKNMLFHQEIKDDDRYLDLVTDVNPIGLEPGAYVDIRIAMPGGSDYLALAHKQVAAINSGILKVVCSEKDIHTYQSLLVDKLMHEGTTIYSIEYVEGAAQKAGEKYYPALANVQSLISADPNILEALKQTMMAERNSLERNLIEKYANEEENETKARIREQKRRLEEGKIKIANEMVKGQKVYDKERAEFEKNNSSGSEEGAGSFSLD